MWIDLFHSVGRIDTLDPALSDRQVFGGFFDQVTLAEELGFDTIWVAESHFSSEVQKQHPQAVIPNYHGEVGLNADSMQLAQLIFSKTQRINFGTAIHNIVGGNGGPIASADRIQALCFLNQFLDQPRQLHIGIAQGRFPYINQPFGISPRSPVESTLWATYKRLIFMEAAEIFLRLIDGQSLSSSQVRTPLIDRDLVGNDELWQAAIDAMGIENLADGRIPYQRRWHFDLLKLVPELSDEMRASLRIIMGSHDPLAQKLAMSLRSVDVFNLSFTPTEKINLVHDQMHEQCKDSQEPWQRWRLPRTVLIFIDQDRRKAQQLASACFDTYIEAMRGTVVLPPKEFLMQRALIGDPSEIAEKMSPGGEHGFEADDRLMLWFEFNQSNSEAIQSQMKLFSEKVLPQLA